MSKKKILRLLFIIVIGMNCKQKEGTILKKSNDMDIDLIKKHLKLQEKIGTEDNKDIYNLTEEDIEIGGQVVEKGMIQNGYTIPDKENFNKKIYEIFEKNMDCSYSKIIKHNNFITCVVNPNKENNTVDTEYDYAYNHIFAFPKYGIITTLPLLNNLVTLKSNNLSINLHQNTISRNKYLFNDSKADLVWLMVNDKDFLKTLVVGFGYDKEEKINDMVIKDLYQEYKSEVPSSPEKIGNIVFVKDCNGNLKIRIALLTYIEKHTSQTESSLIEALRNYVNYLFQEDIDHIFKENLQQKFTLEEKAKIVAYVANIESPAFYKYKYSDNVIGLDAWHYPYTMLSNIVTDHPEVIDIIKKNNYYGLKPLKEAMESEKFQEEQDTTN